MRADQTLPLAGLKVVEFTHMVMGPTTGVILADLGADVIKIEPISGDNTRRLKGSGAGYFPMYNRNKRSLCINLKSEKGKEVARHLVAKADILIENFRPGAMDKLGFSYSDMQAINDRLVYCSLKGFLSGPYEQRVALDEVTQMMGGLAYMTGPPGRPLRAGSSVVDITGGMFGVIAILAAIEKRHRTGKGQHVTSSLFETTAFMVGQHMAQQGVTGEIPPPMPVRTSAWAIYDIFDDGDGEQVFVGVVSDTLWKKFCEEFALDEFAADAELDTNNNRVLHRERILKTVRTLFASFTHAELLQRLERAGVPFAPINRPADLFDDPQMNANGGLVEVTLPSGERAGSKIKLPALPVEMSSHKFGLRHDLPIAGRDSVDILTEAGYSEDEISAMLDAGLINAG